MRNSLKKIGIIIFTGIFLLSWNPVIVNGLSDVEMLMRSGIRNDFDGVDESGKSGSNPTGNTDTSGSISCWFVSDTVLGADGTRVILGMGGDDTDQATNFGRFFIDLRRQAAISVTNKLEIFHGVDGSATLNRVTGGTTISAGTLYNFVATSSGTAWKLYLNGSEETLTVVAGGSNNGDWFGDIGTVGTRHYAIANNWRDGAWGSAYWDGKIDDCFITSDVLSATNVTNLYNSGKPIHPCSVITCSNIRAYWKLGEDDGGTVTTSRAALGTTSTDNFTMENMENADMVKTSYY